MADVKALDLNHLLITKFIISIEIHFLLQKLYKEQEVEKSSLNFQLKRDLILGQVSKSRQ